MYLKISLRWFEVVLVKQDKTLQTVKVGEKRHVLAEVHVADVRGDED